MYIHIFASQTAYGWALLNMLEQEVDLDNHLFIFGLGKDHPMKYPYSSKMQEKILYLKHPADILTILKHVYNADWIYIHLLAYDPTLLFWSLNRKLLRKSTWIVWGSDIYAFQKQKLSIRTRVYERLRRRIIPVFSEIAAFVKEDFELISSVYGSTAKYLPILYPLPVSLEQLENIGTVRKDPELIVMIGNSGDPTNNHIAMIELLSDFRKFAMKVVCPLAYGGTEEYRQLVIKAGIATFGNNFIPWLEMKGKQEYAGQLANVDIALMNHQRQQGLGNILALLYLGKKLFIRSDTTSFLFLKRNNCLAYDIGSIKNMSFAEFSLPNSENSTVSNVHKILKKDYSASLWKNLIKQH